MAIPERGSLFAGKYVVEASLGGGAMGDVFSATHQELRQHVAIKVLKESAPAGGAERMIREARSTLALQSEHVVRVMDVGRDDGRLFIVMEQLQGSDLASLLSAQGSFPVAEAVDYVLQSSAGVADAHARGIVHRDLKPGNLFLTRRPDGSPLVKVLDFGISKSADSDDVEASLTGPSEMLGSPMYMSPEQVRGAKTVDHRTDIWSLGVILFRFLSGKSPFAGGGVRAALASVMADEPASLRDVAPEVPAELEAIVRRCLAKDPADRYQSVSELATALAPFGTADGRASVARLLGERVAPPTRVPARVSRRRPWILAGGACVVIAVPAVALAVLRSKHPAPAPSSSSEVAAEVAPEVTSSVAPSATPPPSPETSAVATSTTPPRAASPRAPSARPARPHAASHSTAPKTAATDDRY